MNEKFDNEQAVFVPVHITSIEISAPLTDLTAQDDPRLEGCGTAWVLVRLHGRPLGMAQVKVTADTIRAADLAQAIWQNLAGQINDHLVQDKLASVTGFDVSGLPIQSHPSCALAGQLEEEPFVSVAIATRDRVDSLRECLQSILALDYSNYEVIVVDNAPRTSATEDYIRTGFAHNPKVRYIREDMPGLAVAHNRALLEIKAPIVAFTDDDVIVDRLWLRALVSQFQRDPRVGCVTGMILPYEIVTPPQLWIEQYGGFSKGYEPKAFDLDENHPGDILFPYSAGKFGSGANMAFRAVNLIARGGFDPALGAGTQAMGGDDLAAFFDVIASGERLVYEPAAILYHKHRREYPGLARQAYGYGVGLAAFLTKTIYDRPARLVEILFKIPAGLRHMLDPRSPKNQKKQADYPKELTSLELKGFLSGPWAYLRSRWRTDKLKAQLPRVNEVVTMKNHLAYPTAYR